MTFIEKLRQRQQEVNSMVSCGLDTDEDLLPISCYESDSVFRFNTAIIDATANLVCAYKPNIAFYSGAKLIYREVELRRTIEYIHKNHPGIPVILDAKRGDTEYTAKMYARELFDRYGADAVTVNPYLGQDACQPFLDRADKGVIVLCRTSNRGAMEFQDKRVKIGRKTMPLYQYVASRVANEWNKNGNCLLVVGATYPEELREVRRIVGDMPILVPGIGAQKGDLDGVIRHGLDGAGFGLIINASRSIIYASKGRDFAKATAREAKKLRDQINQLKETKSD